jgi:integrase
MRHPKRYVAANGDVSWRVRYRATDGTEKSETFYTEDDAHEFAGLLKTLGAARALAYIDARNIEGKATSHALTVDALYAKWMEHKSARDRKGELRHVRSERTLIDYERMYDAHVREAFGAKPANLVTPGDVQTWVDDLGDQLAPKTIADYHSLLHGLYTWGIHPTRGLVVVDPCTETQLPKRRKKPPKGLRPQEWQILHDAARRVDHDAADLLLFLVGTGWRWSEAVAVRVMDVDHFGPGQTYVTLGRILRREGNAYVFIDDAKSEAGARRVRLVGEAEEMVLRRIEGKPPTTLILTAPTGGRWHYPSFHKRYWTRPEKDDAPKRQRILEVAATMGLDRPDITPHWLRHTQAGMLILAGEPLPAIQRRLGHASIKTTVDTYGRMVEDASDAGLSKLAAMLGHSAPRIESSDGGTERPGR